MADKAARTFLLFFPFFNNDRVINNQVIHSAMAAEDEKPEGTGAGTTPPSSLPEEIIPMPPEVREILDSAKKDGGADFLDKLLPLMLQMIQAEKAEQETRNREIDARWNAVFVALKHLENGMRVIDGNLVTHIRESRGVVALPSKPKSSG